MLHAVPNPRSYIIDGRNGYVLAFDRDDYVVSDPDGELVGEYRDLDEAHAVLASYGTTQ